MDRRLCAPRDVGYQRTVIAGDLTPSWVHPGDGRADRASAPARLSSWRPAWRVIDGFDGFRDAFRR
jgi:hypothetical protein